MSAAAVNPKPREKLLGCRLMRRWPLIATGIALAACGSPEADGTVDGAVPGADGSTAACTDTVGLAIGRCVEEGGGPCSSVTDAQPHFEALATGGTVPLIVGFQGAPMFALAVRATGIDPGTEGDIGGQPRVEAQLFDGANQNLSNYSVTIPMTPVGAEADTYEWLYVFLALPGAGNELEGQPLSAELRVEDSADTVRCDSLEFTADALLP
jgi:hypothetical protein